MRNFSIISMSLFIFMYFITGINGTPIVKPKLSRHPVVIVASFDGFRYDYMSKTNTPNLNEIKATGVSPPYITNQFPTKTYPNHHSIVTGLHTESHGVTDNKLYDLVLQQELTVRDESFYKYRDDVIPLWTINELHQDGRYSGVMQWAGSEFRYGPGNKLTTHLQKMDRSMSFETRVDIIIKWITNSTHPANLVFMYFDQPDSTGHKNSPESSAMIKEIQNMDQRVGYLIRELTRIGIYDDINLILMSDHGMEEVSTATEINVNGIVNKEFYKLYGNKSPIYHVNPLPGYYDIVHDAFTKAGVTSHFTVYKREEINTLNPSWFFQNNEERIMPLILVADAGYIFTDHSKSRNVVYGAHGYDNENIRMRPFFIARGPFFKDGVTVQPFANIDVFPLICHMIDVEEPSNNGSLENVLPLLKNNLASDLKLDLTIV